MGAGAGGPSHSGPGQGQLAEETTHRRACLEEIDERVRRALVANEDELAHLAARSRRTVAAGLRRIEALEAALAAEGQRLQLAEHSLTAQLATGEARRDVVAARLTAATLQVRVAEALAGLGPRQIDELAEDADEVVEWLQFRAAAFEGLEAAAVEAELAAWRRAVRGSPPAAGR